MGRERRKQPFLFVWTWVAALLSQNFLIPVVSTSGFEDQKNYYSPDPHAGSPPHGSHESPPHGTSPKCDCGGTPPSHDGGSYSSPPPSTPRGEGGSCGPPPAPRRGGGGYHYPPYSGSPPTPVTVSPPTTPIVTPGTPDTPGITVPSPPFVPIDPNTPITGTCYFWKTHPALIWGLFGWWGTVAGAFGVAAVPGYSAGLSLLDALSNTRTDGLGALYREGTASLLNSMVNKRFHFTSTQVKDGFVASLSSSKGAAAQARIFKLANEGRLKPRA